MSAATQAIPMANKSKQALPAGTIASTVTPFFRDGRIDSDRIRPHIDWLIDEGAQGLSPLGSSGEFCALEIAERKSVLEDVLRANDSRLPVWA